MDQRRSTFFQVGRTYAIIQVPIMGVAPIAIAMVEPVAAVTHWCVTDLASVTTHQMEPPSAYDARLFVIDMCAGEILHSILTDGLHAVARCTDDITCITMRPRKCFDDT